MSKKTMTKNTSNETETVQVSIRGNDESPKQVTIQVSNVRSLSDVKEAVKELLQPRWDDRGVQFGVENIKVFLIISGTPEEEVG